MMPAAPLMALRTPPAVSIAVSGADAVPALPVAWSVRLLVTIGGVLELLLPPPKSLENSCASTLSALDGSTIDPFVDRMLVSPFGLVRLPFR